MYTYYLLHLYSNGYLNEHDFDCLAVKFTLLEGRGQWDKARSVIARTRVTTVWSTAITATTRS